MLYTILFGVIVLIAAMVLIFQKSISYKLYKKYRNLVYEERDKDKQDEKLIDKWAKRRDFWDNFQDNEWVEGISGVSIIIGGIVLLISVISIAALNSNYATTKYNIRNKAEYDAIILELTDDNIKDEFNIRTKDVIDDVTEWNISYMRYMHAAESPWWSWFNPKADYNGTSYINLEEYINHD